MNALLEIAGAVGVMVLVDAGLRLVRRVTS